MAYFVGAALFALAAWFAWAGHSHKTKSLAEQERLRAERPGAKDPELHPSLSMLADFAPSLTIFSLVIFVFGITIAFFAVGALRWLTFFDLAGMYALAGGYGYWLYMKTRHRSVETQRALAARQG